MSAHPFAPDEPERTRTHMENESAHALERLIAVCNDGATGYRKAAGHARDADLRTELEAAAVDREEIASALGYALAELGRPAVSHGSLRGALHRAWLEAVATLERPHDVAVLRACERGERATVDAFIDALGRDLTGDVRSMIQSQLGRVLVANATLARAADRTHRQDGE